MFEIYNEDCLVQLDKLEENSIDSIVTDPPYGLTSITKRFGGENSKPNVYGKDGSFARLTKGFMGKEWDGSGIEYNVEMWQKCLRVLKPGGYLLAFGGSRTFHRIAVAIEDAGFEIRDTIMWLYGSGFPKSHNIGLDIDKLKGCPDRGHRIAVANRHHPDGTIEPIIVARKPLESTVAKNCLKYGVGGINIDECRVGNEERTYKGMSKHKPEGAGTFRDDNWEPKDIEISVNGRFPANTILTYDDTDFEEVCGGFPDTKSGKNGVRKSDGFNKDIYGKGMGIKAGSNNGEYGDSGSASRYFYCAKASKKDRDEGLNDFENISGAKITGRKEGSAGLVMEGGKQNPYAGKASPNNRNTHPTVKPTELMQYLIRLVTPDCGTVLDPFMGSGSTGKACMYENKERNKNYNFIGIEKDKEYCEIARARISYAEKQITKRQEEKDDTEQISLF